MNQPILIDVLGCLHQKGVIYDLKKTPLPKGYDFHFKIEFSQPNDPGLWTTEGGDPGCVGEPCGP